MTDSRVLGIQQPYFFPYIGHFALINYVDHYIFFDTPQYERRSWMNRNRILNPNSDFSYINVPLEKAPQKTAICDMKIDNSQEWREQIFAQLTIYKKKAPYYNKTIEFLKEVLSPDFSTLSELNIHTTKEVCRYIGINTSFDTFSELKLDLEDVNAPDEWALRITEALNYDTYVNALGGMEFFDRSKYTNAGINLKFMKTELKPYVQRIGRFVEGLSIIDVMMFNTVEEIQELLTHYTLL